MIAAPLFSIKSTARIVSKNAKLESIQGFKGADLRPFFYYGKIFSPSGKFEYLSYYNNKVCHFPESTEVYTILTSVDCSTIKKG